MSGLGCQASASVRRLVAGVSGRESEDGRQDVRRTLGHLSQKLDIRSRRKKDGRSWMLSIKISVSGDESGTWELEAGCRKSGVGSRESTLVSQARHKSFYIKIKHFP